MAYAKKEATEIYKEFVELIKLLGQLGRRCDSFDKKVHRIGKGTYATRFTIKRVIDLAVQSEYLIDFELERPDYDKLREGKWK